MSQSVKLHHGDCLDILRSMPDNSVDSIVTDPPYGLKFMGKKWDYDVPDVEVWAECLRVLKPGGHLLTFAGTRTQHRMCCRIEDAGFEIRDMIAWVYGSGFPKSHNLKDDWAGWGTALKPALEPITVARKPFKGTVAYNVLSHGAGALNIDACRVSTGDDLNGGAYSDTDRKNQFFRSLDAGSGECVQPVGRWPANLIHDGSDEVVALFPVTNPARASMRGVGLTGSDEKIYGKGNPEFNTRRGVNDSGDSAARFFYCAKASRSDRNEGLDEFEMRQVRTTYDKSVRDSHGNDSGHARKNHHPTVKPTDLMRYLLRLVTPRGGVVLDPFMGSGSTGKAAVLEGFKFIGIERYAEYVEIARARIADAQRKADAA
ncbi:site-specific DNA-methyltransferase [Pectobacterium carotovorum]|uniref:DNA-methyltransferase n=1 Tax=Pectobacterium carotovorum TaxID=554 RepID=UPI0030178EDD